MILALIFSAPIIGMIVYAVIRWKRSNAKFEKQIEDWIRGK